MNWPSLRLHDRIAGDGSTELSDLARSYLGIRLLIGVLGMSLPIALVLVDKWFLAGSATLRGSMSAYYHSSARDLFVGGLVATGVILCSYLSWRWRSWDFWLSLVAGLAVIGVAAFPTGRADVDASVDSCERFVAPEHPSCVALQVRFGEDTVEHLHLAFTVVVVAAFALLCLVFALRDFGYGRAAHEALGSQLGVRPMWRHVRSAGLTSHLRKVPRTLLYLVCFCGVLGGALWAVVGVDGAVPRAYAGEFAAFTSFGAAWMVASSDLLRSIVAPVAATVSETVADAVD